MRRSRRVQRLHLLRLVAVTALVTTALMAYLGSPANAASGFANPAFQTQWQAGEALAPNFWGPLPLARDGQQESYTEATGGMRTVQYFDKARMELTNTGTVTNGLLATELVTGRLQLGDSTFRQGSPAAIPVAGDPDNLGPTYASISTSGIGAMAPNAVNTPVTRALSASGTVGTFTNAMGDAQTVLTVYDGTGNLTHNVPKAFADYRTRVGLAAIGFGIAEPFWSNVKVAGTNKDVLIQAFERRVLTYTPSNEERFRVEFGNIGQHYYTWRYNSPGALNTPTPANFPITATAAAGATATAGTTATAAANATASATAAPATDTSPPKFTSAPRVPYVTPNSFAVTWTTDKPASSELRFGETENYNQDNTVLRGVYTTDHQVVIRNLTAGRTYYYQIQSRDAAGQVVRDTDNRMVTLPSEKYDAGAGAVPKITNLSISRKTATTFTVQWDTDIASRSRIEYGSTELGMQPSGEGFLRHRTGDNNDPSVTTKHQATAISLEPNKPYRFRIVAVGGDNGNLSSASNDKQINSTNDSVVTDPEGMSVSISELRADQERAGRPTTLTFSTNRNAAAVVRIGTNMALDNPGLYFGSASDPQGIRDYPFPFNRTLNTIELNLRPGVYFYQVAVYGENGTGTSMILRFVVS